MAGSSIAPAPVLSLPQSVFLETEPEGGLYIKAPIAKPSKDTAAVALVRKLSDDADAEAPTHHSKKIRIDTALTSPRRGAQQARLDTNVEKKKGGNYQVADVLDSPAAVVKEAFKVDDDNRMQEMDMNTMLAEVMKVDDIIDDDAEDLRATLSMLDDGQNRLLRHWDGMSENLRIEMRALLDGCRARLQDITVDSFARSDLIDETKERLELQPEAEKLQAEVDMFRAQMEAEKEHLSKIEELKNLKCQVCDVINFDNDFIRCKHGTNVAFYEHGGHVGCYGLKDCPGRVWSCKDCTDAAIWESVSDNRGRGKGACRKRAPAPDAPSLGFSLIYAGP